MNKLVLIGLFFISGAILYGQNDDCLACHSDHELDMERNGKKVTLFVETGLYSGSVHADLECVDCHLDFDPDELPHREGENIARVDCLNCHEAEDYLASIHSRKKVECFDCHSKHGIIESASLASDQSKFCVTCHKNAGVAGFRKSIHFKELGGKEKSPDCLDCHHNSAHKIQGAKLTENQLHELCGECHEEAVANFEKSLHGSALAGGRYLAPNCITCHNQHEIKSSKDVTSKTYVTNIPYLCGDCHKEGTKVSDLRTVSQRHVLEDYAESIHGDGLLKRGLIVTAVCTSCHFSHNILPHENPESSINRDNIAATCMQCHSQIERVHTKVIKGELWEKEPHRIPACIDCHQPHNVRRVFYEENFTDNLCISCHGNKEIHKLVDGKRVSLFVDIEEKSKSAHKGENCIKCHTNVSISRDPVCLNSGKVDCSICHAEHVDDYVISQHGTEYSKGNKDAPYCADCHGIHDILPHTDMSSPTFSKNIPELCGKCHRHGAPAQLQIAHGDSNIVQHYSMSIHGKGLLESGLMVTATCVDCHTNHRELPADNPMSSVNRNNIAETCAICHLGIFEQFKHSIHSPEVTQIDKELPTCADCHQSHTINRTDQNSFRQGIMDQCGRCHLEVTETYFDTFHGKVSKLGSAKTAKCYDCHGSHNILPTYNPKSTLSRENVVNTCKSCHPNSNRKFVGYLTHATHHDKDKYPFLYYTFWAMSILLISTFTFFGLHTLLWLPRAVKERKRLRNSKK